MKGKNNIIRMQFFHMLSRNEFKISLTAVLFFIAISFCELCGKVLGLDISQLYSAAYGWIGHAAMLDIPVMQFFFFLLIFFISSLTFSDSQFVDGKINAKNMIITRCSRKSYILSGAFVNLSGAFLVILIPFLLSLIFSFLIFPIHSSVQYFSNAPTWSSPDKIYALFPSLIYCHPFLYDILAIFYMAVCAGIFAMLSFTLSFFIKRRLLILCIPTLLIIMEDMLFPGNNAFSYYLYMVGMRDTSIFIYLGIPIGVSIVCCFLLYLKIYKMRDELT